MQGKSIQSYASGMAIQIIFLMWTWFFHANFAAMNMRIRNVVYSIVVLLLLWAVWKYRSTAASEPIKLEGKTMGTTFHITYFDPKQRNFQIAVDSLLLLVNK